jgi:uncharacterized membrane protein YhaH (DUF805 family)
MTAKHYLFGFSGRVNRAKIWLWVVIAILLSIVAIVVACIGFDWSATMAALKAHPKGTPLDMHALPHPGSKGVVSIVAAVVLAAIVIVYVWAKLAIYAKRLHDRAKSAWWLVVYLGVPMALHGFACHTAGGPPCAGPHHVLAYASPAGKIAFAVAALVGLWVFIDLYCLKGTKGANKYGADPLEPNWCDPEKPVKGCKPKPMVE